MTRAELIAATRLKIKTLAEREPPPRQLISDLTKSLCRMVTKEIGAENRMARRQA
jgi:hypothetical protein